MHASMCHSHGFDFIPSGFSVFGLFDRKTHEFFSRVVQGYRLHAEVADWEAHGRIYVRLSFAIMRGVIEQFVGHMLIPFDGEYDIVTVICY